VKFRLVVHVRSAAGEDRSALALLDERLSSALALQHVVHGHDLGRGHLKIDVHTDDPVAAFEAVRNVIPDDVLSHTSVFYSEIGDRREHVLWPTIETL
jgi:hypothetical protein